MHKSSSLVGRGLPRHPGDAAGQAPPYELPKEWEWVRLGNVLTVQNGYAFDSSLFSERDGHPLIRIRDLRTNSPSVRLRGKYDGRFVVKAGDYLVGMDGEFRCYKWAGPAALLNQRVCRLHKFDASVMPEFVGYGLNAFLAAIETRTAFATVKHISSMQIAEILFPLPQCLETQHRIVARIEELLAEIREARRLLGEMERETDRLFDASLAEVVAELDRQCPDSPSLSHLLANGAMTIAGGGTPSKSQPGYWGGSVPWVTPKDMKRWEIGDSEDHISPQAVHETAVKLIPSGSVLVVVRGMILAHTFPVAVTMVDVTVNQDMKSLTPRQAFLPKYLGYILRARAPVILSQVEVAAHGTRRLKTETLLSVTVPTLPLKRQREIIARLDAVQQHSAEARELLAQKSALLDRLEQSILERAFRGCL